MTCETCVGTGEIVIGWTWGTRLSPPEPIDGRCPVCRGAGEVCALDLDNHGGAFPSDEEAMGIYWDEVWLAEESVRAGEVEW